MSLSADAAAQPALRRQPLLVFAFTAALFLSALLLFSVEPMFTKMVLPRLGGSPSVWSVTLIFFQAVLLAGYAYAHFISRRLPLPTQAILHLALLTVTIFALPVAISAAWGRPPDAGQAFWLLGLFGVSVGLPAFAISSSAPLLQAWFAQSGHTRSADPYFLYAASNLGSFAALVLYPTVLEPLFGLGQQSLLWSIGFVLLLAAIGGSAVLAAAGSDRTPPAPAEARRRTAPRAWLDRARWTGLALLPSALLVAVTAHISTDVVAAPFLWVIPLGLYLLTFVIAFRPRPMLPHRWMVRLLPLLLVPPAVVATGIAVPNLLLGISIHLSFFFVAAMVCHGELVRRRPEAARITEFYLWMSIGGVIGGILSALVAPQIFSSVAEYPILIAASLLALPAWGETALREHAKGFALAAAFAALLVLPWVVGARLSSLQYVLLLAALALLVVIVRRQVALQFGLALALLFLANWYGPDHAGLTTYRSFFGVNKVMDGSGGRFRVLVHGTTIHGAERVRNDDGTPYVGPPIPSTYYAFAGPLGQGVAAARAGQGSLGRVGVVGLGTGSLACHAKPGESWRFFEIDPEVVRIATDTRRFDFLARCTASAPIVLGDGRLTLADEPDGGFDLIVVDAFASDSIPVHLLTAEAFAGYLRKLSPRGSILLNISNRYMDLAPVVAASAAANGLKAHLAVTRAVVDEANMVFGTKAAIVARSEADIGALSSAMWQPLLPTAGFRTWTDDYSNILDLVLRGLPSQTGDQAIP